MCQWKAVYWEKLAAGWKYFDSWHLYFAVAHLHRQYWTKKHKKWQSQETEQYLLMDQSGASSELFWILVLGFYLKCIVDSLFGFQINGALWSRKMKIGIRVLLLKTNPTCSQPE